MQKDPITLQMQPTIVTCVQTCLAMALGVPVAEVIARYGPDPMNPKKLAHALTECGFIWNKFTYGTLAATGWYFLTVPSLNNRGGHHQIIIHYDLDRGCSGFTVFDPSSKETYAADGKDLVSWSDPIYFHPGGRLPD